MGNFQVDMQSFNGTWTSDVFSTAYEAYIFIAGLTDAAQVEVNNTNVSSLEALDKWYAASTQPTDAPAEVDMGGDFEGFVEAVNAPRDTPLFEDESDRATPQALITSLQNATNIWYTLPGKTNDGIEVRAEIVRSAVDEYGFIVSVGAMCAKVDSFREAIETGDDLVRAEVERLNKPETPRIKALRANITRLQREIDSVKYELAQELGKV